MAQSIYITSAEGHSGKSTVALGVLDALSRATSRVGVFRAIARSTRERDYVLEMLLDHDGVDLPYEECVGVTYDDVREDPDAALSTIVERYKAVEAQCDAVVIVGSDYTDVGSPAELAYNARIAANLGAPVLLVLGGRAAQGQAEQLGATLPRTPAEMGQIADLALAELVHGRAQLFAVIANRVEEDERDEVIAAVRRSLTSERSLDAANVPVWAIPEDRFLVAPSMRGILRAVDGELIAGDPELLTREALGVVVAAMSMVNVLPRLLEGAVVVIPADRSEVLLAALLANASGTFPSISGIVLNGGFDLPEPVRRLIDGLGSNVPIISTELGTYDTAVRVMNTRGRLAADSQRRYDTALSLFETSVDTEELLRAFGMARATVVTPLMFEFQLIDRARASRKRIVLPEGDDDRVLRAAATVLKRGIADLVILGEPFEVRARAIELGIDIQDAEVLSPFDAVHVSRFAEEYARLRAHKGVTAAQAADTVTDVSYFGTMMVHTGLADGMVSGAAHTTAHTIRPAFEIIKTKPGVSVVSSVFLMALADRVLVYGDCAVIPDPTAPQLADIAVSSAATAAQFGIEPRVAMLSYSTGESGSGADVEKVREATALVRERAPELLVEGPIQYDAAADAAVAAAKMPGSQVAGRATVFVFPDLNTGNNTYKAVQRSAGAVAIGPVLQGLNKPINDLSRGALVEDIVNTIAITAIQAQAQDADTEQGEAR
ncbi:phosphate acetyltransferase [Microbacterium aurantiacum]|uniref:Phosphate acetyltransferase n=1 Tax=Microbacterium aurantiacum TaxID=162393 RepID=A0AAJ2HJ46_9MICO|nr:phosphate acetyltransferase [Microbacterium aurantiacum]MDS0245729.1 phosphate acetyltransferase [Microbacterium aurantiacum]ODT11113.1 MAG: phosphate acetyltransferase [Microbacterium sp. SCN 70-18]